MLRMLTVFVCTAVAMMAPRRILAQAPPEQNRFTRTGAGAEPTWEAIRGSAWEQDVDLGTTQAAGTKRPNAWGLHDTLGNVWEWVSDIYDEKLFADSVATTVGSTHVLKDGSFVSDVKNTTWSKHAGGPGSGFDVGFRIVREIR